MRLINLTAAVLLMTGASGCVTTADSGGVCDAVRPYARATQDALLSDEAVSDAVGEAATDLLIGLRAGCGWG